MNIGVFDSGLGGLTVVQALQKVLKGVDLYYVADTKNAPYGEKTPKQILNYSLKVTEHLIQNHKIEVLILACNTATSFAIKVLRERYPFLIIIGTEPGLKPASLKTLTNNIAVLATSATLDGKKYEALVSTLSKEYSVQFFAQACHGLVEQIETGAMGSEETKEMLSAWLLPMQENNVDSIVLGCTHYPLIENIIIDIMGQDIFIIHTGDAIAKHLMKILYKEKKHRNKGKLSIVIERTGEINHDLLSSILSIKIKSKKVVIF